MDPDEGRNAEVAREMLEAGEWIVPRFHGLPYLDKPALYFDAVGLSFALFGRSEATARLPSVLFAFLTGLGTYLLGRRLWGRAQALAGLAVLVSAPLFMGFARIVIFDIALTCFVTWALLFAEEGRRGWRGGFPLAWMSTALAVLTKGPVGLLLPVLGTLTLAAGQGRPLGLRRYFHPLPVSLFALMVLPWVLAMEAVNPGFVRYALLVETLERLTLPTFERSAPFYFYGPVLILGLFPWSLASAGSVPRWLRGIGGLAQPSPKRGLLLTVAGMVLVFTLSTSKLGGYILPAFPLLALLLGSEAFASPERAKAWSLTAGLGLTFIGLSLAVISSLDAPLARWLQQPESLAPVMDVLFFRAGMVFTGMGLVILCLKGLGQPRHAVLMLALCGPATVLAGKGPALVFAEHNSSRRLAEELRRLGGDGVRVATVFCFPVGIDYYLGRVVPLVTETAGELTSTYVQRSFDRLQKGSAALWSPDTLSARVKQKTVDILVTRGYRPPSAGFYLRSRVGIYSIWSPRDGFTRPVLRDLGARKPRRGRAGMPSLQD